MDGKRYIRLKINVRKEKGTQKQVPTWENIEIKIAQIICLYTFVQFTSQNEKYIQNT